MPSIDILHAAGTQVTGLIVGTLYSIETVGGPWHWRGLVGGSEDTFAWALKLNSGDAWYPLYPASDPLVHQTVADFPSWAAFRSHPDADHVRVYWYATQTSIWVGVADSTYTDNTGSLDYAVVSNFCEHGGEINPGTPDLIILGTEQLLSILSLLRGTWFWTAASFFLGSAIDVSDLCALPRPPEQSFSPGDIKALVTGTDPPGHKALLEKVWLQILYLAWPLYCRCTPGTPTPVPYPTHPPPTPPGLGPGPAVPLVCDQGDLCSQMSKLLLAVNAIGQKLQETDRMVTLIQRQHVPFAYILGTNHAGLTLSGSFTVQGILGLAVTASVVPAWLGSSADNPLTFYTIGWISVGTAHGWTDRREIRHAEQLLLELGGDITRVGYNFEVGVTASIRELVRES